MGFDITREASPSAVEVADGDGVYCVSHDVTEGGLTVTLTCAVAEVAGVEPEAVAGQLSGQVDPGALDALFRTRPGGEPRDGGALDLTVAGHDVTVYGDGTIEIRE